MRSKRRKKRAKRKPDDGTRPLMIWGVPRNVKARFKARCSQQEVSMKQVIIEFMEEYVEV